MRIWSISPEYMDTKRLGAQWCEALLCRNVIKGLTKGYKHHPQALRLMKHPTPLAFVNSFLYTIWKESQNRGFKYDKNRLEEFPSFVGPMPVTKGQLYYEFHHLQNKLTDSGELERYHRNERNSMGFYGIKPNDLFIVVPGDIEDFEKIKS
jgi:hypothetical protein